MNTPGIRFLVPYLPKAVALAIAAWFLVAVFWGFPDSPAPWFDEGVNLGIAKTFVQERIYSLRLAPGEYIALRPLFITTNFPLLGFIILAFSWWGIGLLQAKIVMMAFLLLFLVLDYYLMRRLAGRRAALWSTALVATFLPFYGNGLSGGLGEVPGLTYLFLGLLLLQSPKSHGQKHPLALLLAGIAFGLCAATKTLYLVVLLPLALTEIGMAIGVRAIPWKRWLLIGLGILLPLIIWFRTLFPNSFAPVNLASVLSYYNNPYQVEHIVLTNIQKFFTESTPIHFTLLFVAISVSVWYAHRQRQIRETELVLFLFIVVNILAFIRGPGWYRYFFPAHLVALAWLPAAVFRIEQQFSSARLRTYGAPVALTILIIVQSGHFLTQRGTELYYNPAPREFAREIDRELGPDADIFIIHKPEIWFLLKNRKARQYMQMNEHIAFGRDIFANASLPQYLVSGEPDQDPYLRTRKELLQGYYTRVRQNGPYVLFARKD